MLKLFLKFYFIFTKEGQMKNNLEGLSVSSKDDKLRNTSIQSLGGFIGSFFNFFESSGGLENFEDFFLKFFVSKGYGSRLGGISSVILLLREQG
jgi:hypothetical protein